MYEGHLILLILLFVFLLSVYHLLKKSKLIFSYVCFGISLVFLVISGVYYYDVFIANPTSEGYAITWSMKLLGQHEDFLFRNGTYFGLYWGLLISSLTTIIGIFNILGYKHKSK